MQIVKALVCQILAFSLVVLLNVWLSRWGVDIRLLILLQASLAAGFSSVLRQPVWWRFIHLSFLPAVAAMLAMNLPSWLYLLVLLLLTLVFWGTVKGDVPLFLSSSAVGDALIAIVARENPASFADIGAGIGTVVVPLAKQFPSLRIKALERAPLPWLFAYWRCRKLSNVEVSLGSLWHGNLADQAVVFAFLSPLVMQAVAEKIRREMRKGSLFISSSFPVADWLPETVVEIDDRRKTRLYCYRL